MTRSARYQRQDIDYWSRLDASAASWLNEFCRTEYEGRPDPNAPQEAKRTSWRVSKAHQRRFENDALNHAYTNEVPDQSVTQTPESLFLENEELSS